ncbi:hypothetical protein VTO42DRAFT_179 [Malbranchea cinnamomea]
MNAGPVEKQCDLTGQPGQSDTVCFLSLGLRPLKRLDHAWYDASGEGSDEPASLQQALGRRRCRRFGFLLPLHPGELCLQSPFFKAPEREFATVASDDGQQRGWELGIQPISFSITFIVGDGPPPIFLHRSRPMNLPPGPKTVSLLETLNSIPAAEAFKLGVSCSCLKEDMSAIHHDESECADPDHFNPERWLKGNKYGNKENTTVDDSQEPRKPCYDWGPSRRIRSGQKIPEASLKIDISRMV